MRERKLSAKHRVMRRYTVWKQQEQLLFLQINKRIFFQFRSIWDHDCDDEGEDGRSKMGCGSRCSSWIPPHRVFHLRFTPVFCPSPLLQKLCAWAACTFNLKCAVLLSNTELFSCSQAWGVFGVRSDCTGSRMEFFQLRYTHVFIHKRVDMYRLTSHLCDSGCEQAWRDPVWFRPTIGWVRWFRCSQLVSCKRARAFD